MFLRDKGRFQRIVVPGEPIGDDIIRIDNRGRIAGTYQDDAGAFHGFLRDSRGRFITVDFPGAAGTAVYDVNDRSQIVGVYSNTDMNTGRAADRRSFLRDERGRFTTIQVPGSVQTQVFGINNRGQLVGEYLDGGGRFHGFVLDRGRLTTLDVRGSAATGALDINDRGQIVGIHADDPTVGLHGFLLSGGVYTTFDAPSRPFTLPAGINNLGQIVVYGFAGPGTFGQGFLLARGVKGPFTPIVFPGALGTGPSGINDRRQIVGLYATPAAPPSGQASPMRLPMMMSAR